jgi:hypothetical protein
MNPKKLKKRLTAEEEKERPEVVKFVELNTKSNIAIRDVHMYLDDVKLAININTLEQRIKTKYQFIELLKKSSSLQTVIQNLENSAKLDRHRLIKLIL